MIKTQKVIMKGTKDGLLLLLDDSCSFSELLKELEEKLSGQKNDEDSRSVHVRVHTGNRILTKEQQKEIEKLVHFHHHLHIESIESNVILKEDAERMKQESEIHVVNKVVRSGQILKVMGDLLLIGDVNPGGKVVARGNIFILGALKGIAHAGCDGNEEAVICASNMNPMQLRIADCLNRAPDQDEIRRQESECAYIDENRQIIIDRLAALRSIRPNLNRFMEGGI
ncbi:septum site-determining protein MinC [Fervidibacillus halotolerans]|uniref:Probable septum site-determining protein MinC n=1 Tax=Fervidibacillus halotolerans TaxID=2980027 RepID=A0A9E8RXW3_9BACI|nr:septum site-determining protein MinC [Fervidibacillus halotolerans]WAA11583.1 septum site-determining protein MinC [Fervidibacillus halotolerans]